MQAHELIYQRTSPFIFEDRPIDPDVVHRLFEAARWAPSSYNDQPWDFVVAVKGRGEGWENVYSALIEPNQQWANRVPLFIVTVARKEFRKREGTNPHSWYDVGAATMLLSLQATDMGLVVRQMAGFDREAVGKTLQIPDGCEPVTVLAVGYPGKEEEGLLATRQERHRSARQRRPLDHFVHDEVWST